MVVATIVKRFFTPLTRLVALTKGNDVTNRKVPFFLHYRLSGKLSVIFNPFLFSLNNEEKGKNYIHAYIYIFKDL